MLQQNVLRAWLNRFQLCFTSRRAGQQPQKWPTRHIVLSVIIINGAFSVNIPHKKCPDFENPSQRGKAEGLKKIRGSLHKDSSSIGGPVTDWLTRSLTDCSGLWKRLSVWILVLLLITEPIKCTCIVLFNSLGESVDKVWSLIFCHFRCLSISGTRQVPRLTSYGSQAGDQCL